MKYGILITSAGSGPSVSAIKSLLKIKQRYKFMIIACDIQKLSSGNYLSDHSFILKGNKHNKIKILNKNIKKFNIKIIIPVNDKELIFFSSLKIELFKKFNCKVIVDDSYKLNFILNKLKINDFINKNNLAIVPQFSINKNLIKSNKIILKPITGHGSKGIRIVSKISKIEANLKNFFYQRFITGKEISIDCYSNFELKNELVLLSPRIRLEIKNGQAVKSKLIIHKKLERICHSILKKLNFNGFSCFQFIISNKKIYFIEMNPRIGTGIIHSMMGRYNFFNIIVNNQITANLLKKNNTIKKKFQYMVRYHEEVYL